RGRRLEGIRLRELCGGLALELEFVHGFFLGFFEGADYSRRDRPLSVDFFDLVGREVIAGVFLDVPLAPARAAAVDEAAPALSAVRRDLLELPVLLRAREADAAIALRPARDRLHDPDQAIDGRAIVAIAAADLRERRAGALQALEVERLASPG